MDGDFWHERWEAGQLAFHQAEVNPWLERFWPELDLAHGSTVFVPLCGKSRDMLWLAERGHRVLGVELSPIACQAFFDENGLDHDVRAAARFTRFEGRDVTLLAGDFFDLEARQLADVTAVYDRAALVALPGTMRRYYAEHLLGILPGGTRMLLVTLEYAPGQMQGPPFSVADTEVRELFGDGFEIERLLRSEAGPAPPPLAERGLTELSEAVHLLQ